MLKKGPTFVQKNVSKRNSIIDFDFLNDKIIKNGLLQEYLEK